MRAVLQRVRSAQVDVGSETVGKISSGWLILLGICHTDQENELEPLVRKITRLRAFNDAQGKMNLDIKETCGEILVVSQFTLYGDCRKGRRPGFSNAAPPDLAKELYNKFVDLLRKEGFKTETGRFGAHMQVKMEGDGPVTLLIDSDKSF